MGSPDPEETPFYCSRAEVRATLSTAASPGQGDPASIDTESLDDAREDAQGEIDMWLANHYNVPFASVPNQVRTMARAIAAYRATLTFYGTVPVDPNEPAVKRYTDVRALLEALNKGTAVLPPDPDGPDGPEPPLESRRRPKVINPYAGTLFGPCAFGLEDEISGRRT